MPTDLRCPSTKLLHYPRAFEAIAMDDTLDLLDLLISDILREAHNDGEKERLRTLRDLDAAALQLWDALQILLDNTIDAAAARTQTYAQIPRERLLEAGTQVETLARPPDDHYYPELVDRYRQVRRFLPTLLHLLYAPLLTPVASRNLLLYQSPLSSIQCRHANVRRRKDDTYLGTATKGITE
jgi:hypothetical protein